MRTCESFQMENGVLHERLSRLSDAGLRINESLELDAVLQGALESARSLTHARYSFITTLDDAGQVEDFLVSGFGDLAAQQLWDFSENSTIFEYLSTISHPLRVPDFVAHVRELGLPEFRPPPPVSSLLTAPMRHRGARLGNIQVAKSGRGEEFTQEDEETLVMFASQASLVIANARRHQDAQRCRTDLETLINTTPVGIAVFGMPAGALVSLISEARRIVDELREPDQSPEHLFKVMTIRRADGRETSLRDFPLAQVLRTRETVRVEEIVMERPGGRSITVLVNATPVCSDDGAVQSVVVTLQDMTPLEELERHRAEFLGMVSHELRAPLASIKGSASTLIGSMATLDPAERLLLSRLIDQQADHMSGLITDLLDVARVDGGTIGVVPVPADPRSMVDEARTIFTSAGGRNAIRIDLPLDLPMVMADHRRVVQVFENLLSNASRNSPEDSAIRVGAVRDGPNVVLSVADDGRGLAKDQLPHVFRKFTRIDADDQPGEIAGFGLGLAICKGIVEAHGGRIWADSDGPGLGARFTFTLPAANEAVRPTSATPVDRHNTPQRAGHVGTRILVIDDDPQMLRSLRDGLSNAGYLPIVTGDPLQVGPLLEKESPHLVLLDLLLPGVDGIALMENTPGLLKVPVIFLSAYGRDRIIAQALETGADDYIVKPFSPTELVARIETVLRRRLEPLSGDPPQPYRLDELTISYVERRVYLRDQSVQLTDIEYRVLFELSANAGRVQTHHRLLQRVWGAEHSDDNGPLRIVVKNLRSKLGDNATNPTYIFTELRVGYWMPKV